MRLTGVGAAIVPGEAVGSSASTNTVTRLRQLRTFILTLVVSAFAVELASRYLDDFNPVTAEFMSLGATLTLAASVLVFAQSFVKYRDALIALWVAAICSVITSGLRISERIGLTWFDGGPFDDFVYYHQMVTATDFATVVFLFIGFLLLAFDSIANRIRLAEKSESLQRLISEHEKTERERQDLERQLLQAQKTEGVGLLAGGIAHDYNNILTGILGNAKLAMDDLPADSPVRETIQQIEYGASRAAYLTDQLLTYGGESATQTQVLDLSRLVRDMAGLMEVAVSKSIELKLNLEADLPAIQADMGQLRHVVLNLVTNASEALEDQRGTVAVRTGTRECSAEYLEAGFNDDPLEPGQYVYVSVDDTGPGMDEETLARICDPFFSTKFPGRGLGLSAVLGIVRGHGGTLRVESQLSAGTRVMVLLPIATDLAPEEAVTSEGKTGDAVLIVDDEELVRRVAANILGRAGYHVIEAESGESALEAYHEHANVVTDVLLDLTLPGLNGDAVLQELRQLNPALHIAVASGKATTEIIDVLGTDANVPIIRKPYRPDDLLRVFPPKGNRRPVDVTQTATGAEDG